MESIQTPQRVADKKLNNASDKYEPDEIADETEDRRGNDDEIEDFYEDEASPKKPTIEDEPAENEIDNNSENIDLDYS